MSACQSWCQEFVGNHSSRHKEKGGRYTLERETQGVSFKGPTAPTEVHAKLPVAVKLPATAELSTPVDATAPVDPTDVTTQAMSACQSWCQEFVGNHSSRHKEKGGRYALEPSTEDPKRTTSAISVPAPVETSTEDAKRGIAAITVPVPAETSTEDTKPGTAALPVSVPVDAEELPLRPTTRAMSACQSWCQEFVGNHSSRHKEKGG